MNERCAKCARIAVWAVLYINASVFLVKISLATMSHSRSLLADSLESMINLIISLIVLASLKISDRDSDQNYPYGYGNVEFIASGVAYFLLFLVSLLFLFVSIRDLAMLGPEKAPSMIAAGGAVISIIGNQIAYKYSRCVGEKLRSPVILASAWASRADVITSYAVVIAVVFANLGQPKLDHVVGILIGLFIAQMTVSGMANSIRGLMDYSPQQESEKIHGLLHGIRGVTGIKDLKTRQVGRKIWIDLDVYVSSDCIMREGINLVKRLKGLLQKNISNVGEISVHLSPANWQRP